MTMRMTLRTITAISVLLSPCLMAAQEADSLRRWTLDECIDRALEHNIELSSERLSVEERDISLSDSRWAFAPGLSASAGYNLSIGRVLDETTYDFITNETVGSSSASVSGSVPFFNGLRNLRQLQYSRLDREAAALQVEKAADDLRLNVTAYFLEVLCAWENIRDCEAVAASLRKQEEHTSEKVRAGKMTRADLLQIQSQLSEAENSLIVAEHSYGMSRLNLCQLLEIEDYSSFIPSFDSGDSLEYVPKDYAAILDGAERLPEIGLARKEVELARKNVQLARSSYYPSLSLSAGYGSSYSNVRQKIIPNGDGTYTYSPYPFIEQYRDNASAYVSFGLSVPILNGMSARNGVRRAKVQLQRSELALETARKSVRKDILQAAMDTEAAWKKYTGSVSYLSSAREAARQIGVKYEVGAATVVEYNTAMSTLVEAQTQHLSAKYEYLFKLKVLEFYESRQ